MPKIARKLAAGHFGKVPHVASYATQSLIEGKKPRGRAAQNHHLVAADANLRYIIEERIFDEKFDGGDHSVVTGIRTEEFTLSRLLENGLNSPLHFTDSLPKGMMIPYDLTPQRVAEVVGVFCKVEVIDCATQEGVSMYLGDFVRYFTGESHKKPLRTASSHKIYNLIDLEVSDTALSDEINSPELIRKIDWALNVWPKNLPPSSEGKTMYPRTQKYVLMSKAGSYTDFHIDFGGSSVWYHLLYGKKLFFLLPPSAKNKTIFAQWASSGQREFLGDEVDDCERLELNPGSTLIIPSGWIHAVYTMEDSLVIGGNFLHIFNAEMQLDVALLEQALKVKKSIRYPFFNDLQWFAARHYLNVWKNCTHKVNKFELNGVQALVESLKSSLDLLDSELCPAAETQISNPAALLVELDALLLSKRIVKSASTIVFGFSHLHCSRFVTAAPEQRRKARVTQKPAPLRSKDCGTDSSDVRVIPSRRGVEMSTQTDEVKCCRCSSLLPVFSCEPDFPETARLQKITVESVYPAIDQLIVKHKANSGLCM